MPPVYSAFVGHLAKEATTKDLTELFSRCGDVKDVFIHRNVERPYCYAFVRFSDVKELLKAVVQLNRWPLHGKEMKVDIASECREVVFAAAKHRKPSRNVVLRDGSIRAQIKEACVELNENVDFTSGGIMSLDSKFVLDSMSKQRSGPTGRLTGMPSAECLSTLERMRNKLLNDGEYNHAIPQRPHNKASSFFHALRALADDINQFLEEHEDLATSVDAKMADSENSQKSKTFQQARIALQQQPASSDKVTGAVNSVRDGATNSVGDGAINSTGGSMHKERKTYDSNALCQSGQMQARADFSDDRVMYGIDVYRHRSSGTTLVREDRQMLEEHSHFMTSAGLSSNSYSAPAVLFHPNMSPALYPPNRSTFIPSTRSTAGLLPYPPTPIPTMYGAFGRYDHTSPVKQPWDRQNMSLKRLPPGAYPSQPTPLVNSSCCVPYNGPLTTPKLSSDSTCAEAMEDGSSAKTNFQCSDSGETSTRGVISCDSNAGDCAFSDAEEEEDGGHSSIIIPDKLRHLFEQQSNGANSKECLSMLRELGRQNSNMLFTRPDSQLEESCDLISSDSGTESFEDPVQNPCDPRYSVSQRSLGVPQRSVRDPQRSVLNMNLKAVIHTVGDGGEGSQNGGPYSKKTNTQALDVIGSCSMQGSPPMKGLNIQAMDGVLSRSTLMSASLGRGRSLNLILSRSNSHQ